MLFLSVIMTLSLLPALFSCAPGFSETGQETHTVLSLCCSTRSPEEMSGIDLFTFNNDRLMHLDSYQHLDGPGTIVDHRSQNGEKLLFACTNIAMDRYGWASVNSFDSLKGIMAELSHEKRGSPCMTGSICIEAGSGQTYRMEMKRIAGEVVLRSIGCDFRDRGYDGCVITDVKVYLTNVSSSCAVTSDGAIVPTSIVNSGRLDMDDVMNFAEPGLIFQEMQDIDSKVRTADIRMRCYPNAGKEDCPGTPFTRLVIEGKLDGETCWWPININRSGLTEEEGIYRNRQYVFDIMIRNKGTSDPDTVIKTDDADIKMTILPWKEKEDCSVQF